MTKSRVQGLISYWLRSWNSSSSRHRQSQLKSSGLGCACGTLRANQWMNTVLFAGTSRSSNSSPVFWVRVHPLKKNLLLHSTHLLRSSTSCLSAPPPSPPAPSVLQSRPPLPPSLTRRLPGVDGGRRTSPGGERSVCVCVA